MEYPEFEKIDGTAQEHLASATTCGGMQSPSSGLSRLGIHIDLHCLLSTIELSIAFKRIVGAGFAGLRCADVLTRHGFQVTILEARNRLGGRVAQSNHLGHVVDL
jgi:NADPH-dependent 2,4-dienoyl-CoA reductase/sulfur reductase-like enzyme